MCKAPALPDPLVVEPMMVEVPLDPSGNLGKKVGWFGGRSCLMLAGTSIYVIYTIYIYILYLYYI